MGLSDLQHEQLSLARFHLSNSLILYQEFDDKLGQAHVLSAFGQVDDKDYLRSGRAQLEEGLALFRELGDLYGVRQCLIRLGQLAIRQGEFETARDWLEEGMALGRSLATRGIVHDIIQLGDLAFWQDSYLSCIGLVITLGEVVEDGLGVVGDARGRGDLLGAEADGGGP
jgi:hypothetical protein